MTGFPFSAEALPHLEQLLAVFRAGGLPDHLAGAAGDMISTFMNGFAFEESVWEDRQEEVDESPRDQPVSERSWAEIRETLERYFRELPPDRFPNLVELSDVMLQRTNDERFDLGIEIIIRGLASYAAEHPRPAE